MKIKIYISANEGLPNLEGAVKFLFEKIKNSKIPYDNLEIISREFSKFEYPALNKLWLDSHIEDFYGLYLHAKGASKTNEQAFTNCLAWAEYMLYGLLDNYLLCLHHMENGADLVGSMWYRHFKGNFFWFKSSYIRNLKSPSNYDTNNRYPAEFWCAGHYWLNKEAPQPKVKNLYYIPIKNDNDFINVAKAQYIPELNKKEICEDFHKFLTSKNLQIFDIIKVSEIEYFQYNQIFKNFLNYDGEIIKK
jgi:hypothetical protein